MQPPEIITDLAPPLTGASLSIDIPPIQPEVSAVDSNEVKYTSDASFAELGSSTLLQACTSIPAKTKTQKDPHLQYTIPTLLKRWALHYHFFFASFARKFLTSIRTRDER